MEQTTATLTTCVAPIFNQSVKINGLRTACWSKHVFHPYSPSFKWHQREVMLAPSQGGLNFLRGATSPFKFSLSVPKYQRVRTAQLSVLLTDVQEVWSGVRAPSLTARREWVRTVAFCPH